MARLLLIDDEKNIRRLYEEELREAGYRTRSAATGAEAEELLKRESFDLVLLDVQLRGESGLDVLNNIVRQYEGLPVILCTAFGSYKEDFASWLAEGYVVKSSDLSELKDEVRRVLGRHGK